MYSKIRNPACGGASNPVWRLDKNKDSTDRFNFKDTNAHALPVLPLLLLRWLPGGIMRGAEYVVKNPKRADATPGSFSINTRTGKWADFASGDKGSDVISLAAYLFNISQNDARKHIAEMMGVRHD